MIFRISQQTLGGIPVDASGGGVQNLYVFHILNLIVPDN